MSTELIVPTLGESITEATVSKWLKNIGDNFEADEPLVEIETDKITVEVPAPHAGSLKEIKVSEGTDVEIGGILGIIDVSKGKKPTSKKTETNFEISDLIPIEFMKLTYVLGRYISVLVFQLDF